MHLPRRRAGVASTTRPPSLFRLKTCTVPLSDEQARYLVSGQNNHYPVDQSLVDASKLPELRAGVRIEDPDERALSEAVASKLPSPDSANLA